MTYYIGEKLNTSVALDVDAKDGAVERDDDYATNNTWNYTSDEDDAADVLTYKVADENAVVILPDNSANTGRTSYTDNIYDGNTNRSVIVWNEAGTDSETYRISLTWVTKNAAIGGLKSVKMNGENWPVINGFASLQDAVAYADAHTVNLPTTGTGYSLTVDTTLWGAAVAFTNSEAIDEDNSTLLNSNINSSSLASTIPSVNTGISEGSYIVIKLANGLSTDPSTWDVAYYVYKIAENN